MTDHVEIELSISELQKTVHNLAVKKGWWDKIPCNIAEQLANMHTELSEAWEELRNNHGITEIYYNEGNPEKPEGFPVELADCVIRILDTCEAYGIDLEEVIMLKHRYNVTRPYRHGGKKA